LVSNAVEMKGFANMQDYKTAFREKGVIGSVLEFGGSAYVVYRAVDELADKLRRVRPRREFGRELRRLIRWRDPPGPDGSREPSGDIWFF
jgi:hypothetical protein